MRPLAINFLRPRFPLLPRGGVRAFGASVEAIVEGDKRLHTMLAFNRSFVARRQVAEEARLARPPEPARRMIAVVTCMDSRLTMLLPRALNISDGDAKIIKNAGAVITHPFGGIVRSVMVALFQLGCSEVFVIGHHDCGMTHIDAPKTVQKIVESGIPLTTLTTLQHAGIDVEKWLTGFTSVHESVLNSVEIIRNHPLCPPYIPVHGLIMDPDTGLLELVVDGYPKAASVAGAP
jgi:carbonic anhydrase